MARHDICQGVGLASSSGIKECLTLFPDTHTTMMILEILCKAGHACTHVDTQASSFYGHVTLGLRIHFPYLSQSSVSKTCSFINSCIHFPSNLYYLICYFLIFYLEIIFLLIISLVYIAYLSPTFPHQS